MRKTIILLLALAGLAGAQSRFGHGASRVDTTIVTTFYAMYTAINDTADVLRAEWKTSIADSNRWMAGSHVHQIKPRGAKSVLLDSLFVATYAEFQGNVVLTTTASESLTIAAGGIRNEGGLRQKGAATFGTTGTTASIATTGKITSPDTVAATLGIRTNGPSRLKGEVTIGTTGTTAVISTAGKVTSPDTVATVGLRAEGASRQKGAATFGTTGTTATIATTGKITSPDSVVATGGFRTEGTSRQKGTATFGATGTTTVIAATGQIQAATGSDAAPEIAGSGDTNTGIRFTGGDKMQFVQNGLNSHTFRPYSYTQTASDGDTISIALNGTSTLFNATATMRLSVGTRTLIYSGPYLYPSTSDNMGLGISGNLFKDLWLTDNIYVGGKGQTATQYISKENTIAGSDSSMTLTATGIETKFHLPAASYSNGGRQHYFGPDSVLFNFAQTGRDSTVTILPRGVGIGTASPQAKLSIVGTAGTGTGIHIVSSTQNKRRDTWAQACDTSSTTLRLDSAGNPRLAMAAADGDSARLHVRTDSTEIYSKNAFALNVPAVAIKTAASVKVGAVQWDVAASDSINGASIAARTIPDLALPAALTAKSGGVSDADYGDVAVSSGAWAVEDDSHNHTSATTKFVIGDSLRVEKTSLLKGDVTASTKIVVNDSLRVEETSLLKGTVTTTADIAVGTKAVVNDSLRVEETSLLKGTVTTVADIAVGTKAVINDSLRVEETALLKGDVTANTKLVVNDSLRIEETLRAKGISTFGATGSVTTIGADGKLTIGTSNAGITAVDTVFTAGFVPRWVQFTSGGKTWMSPVYAVADTTGKW